VDFAPYFGKYARTGRSGGADYSYQSPYTGPGDNSAGGGDYRGYDPRLYEAPPQAAPAPAEPLPPLEDGGGAGPPVEEIAPPDSGPPAFEE
jgi:hypothetical protein